MEPIWIDALITIIAVTITLLVLVVVARGINHYLNKRTIALQDGYLFLQKGKRPIFFTDHIDANIWIKECSWAEVYWEVYSILDGEIKYLGNSRELTLI